MKLQVLGWLCALLLVPAVPAVASPDNPAVPSEPEQFQVREKTEVPNLTLQPGSYSIRIVDHLRDRVILQVSGKGVHQQSTFLAVPAATMANAPVGPIPYSTGPKGKAALKGFAFPGGTAVEFVYPKNDAVSIAQANGTRVMAIDPASEGRVAGPKLSQNDMQLITLWMLEPSRVGPGAGTATIAASHYQAPVSSQQNVETAQAQPVQAPAPAPAASPMTAQMAPSTAARTSPHRQRPVQIAQNDVPTPPPARLHTRPAGITALPHTASQMPLLWLSAVLSFLGAGLLTARRLALQA